MPEWVVVDDENSVKNTLERAEWGYAEINGTRFLFCPWCQAMIGSFFNNAHEPGVTTPKAVHIQYHQSIARAIKGASK